MAAAFATFTALAQEVFRNVGLLQGDIIATEYNRPNWVLKWTYTLDKHIFLERSELHLFELWLGVNDHKNHVQALKKRWRDEGGELPPVTASTKKVLGDLINEEQKKRFALWAEVIDIQCAVTILVRITRAGEWIDNLDVMENDYKDFLDAAEYQGHGGERGPGMRIGGVVMRNN